MSTNIINYVWPFLLVPNVGFKNLFPLPTRIMKLCHDIRSKNSAIRIMSHSFRSFHLFSTGSEVFSNSHEPQAVCDLVAAA